MRVYLSLITRSSVCLNLPTTKAQGSSKFNPKKPMNEKHKPIFTIFYGEDRRLYREKPASVPLRLLLTNSPLSKPATCVLANSQLSDLSGDPLLRSLSLRSKPATIAYVSTDCFEVLVRASCGDRTQLSESRRLIALIEASLMKSTNS